ncbi:MAG: serine hydrolase domain-containing protein, partial [Verrucomicrobiota bacterium]
ENGLHRGAQLALSLHGKNLKSIVIGESSPGHPMSRETLNLWLSTTKPISAVLLAQLKEKGELSWNDLVARFIPEFAQKGKEPITLWNLLTHTGGFRGADAMWNPEPWDLIIERICNTPLEPRWVVGEKAGYHISGSWFILGEIIQRITQKPFQDHVREALFVPLGMENCWIGMPESRYHQYTSRLGTIEVTEKQPTVPHPHFNTQDAWLFCRPASNGRGPMEELLHFYEMLDQKGTLHGKTVLQPESVLDLTHRHRIGMFDHSFRQNIDWGLGFIHDSKENEGGHLVYGFGPHATRETFGHSGSQSSSAFLDRTHGLAVAWFCNGMPGELLHQKRAKDLNACLY